MSSSELTPSDVIRCYIDDNAADLFQSVQRVDEYMQMIVEHLRTSGCQKPFPISFDGDLLDALVEVIQGLARTEAALAIEARVKDFSTSRDMV